MTKCNRCGKENVDPVYPHTCTPLALVLADWIDQSDPMNGHIKAAAELRRLHAENEALRGQNKKFRDALAAACDSLGPFVCDREWSDLDMQFFDKVCAALAQAGEVK
jgi:hypothetical protein